jgi:hypothetical protein
MGCRLVTAEESRPQLAGESSKSDSGSESISVTLPVAVCRNRGEKRFSRVTDQHR